MREDTPLLRGQAAAGELDGGAAAVQQRPPHEGLQADAAGRRRFVSPALLSRARSHPLLLAVAAVGAAVLMIVLGLVSTSGQAGGPQGGDSSLALTATPPRHDSDIARYAEGYREGDVGGRGGERGSNEAGSGERGGSKATGGGWKSLPDRSSDGQRLHGGSGSSSGRPNVFFFLIDDMGFGDIGYQSTDLSGLTPNLDALAAGGVKLTNYYTMTLCTPARASIMTGRYPVRYGMQYAVIMPGSPWGLPLNEKVLPQYMNEAGYESHMVGKWHLGSHEAAALPNHRGFKTFLGYLHGIDTYYSHKNTEAEIDGKYFFDMGYGNATGYHDVTRASAEGVSCSDGHGGPVWDDGRLDSLDPAEVCYTGTYSTDAFVGRARQIIRDKTPFDEEPLFLYLAHQAVHAPTGPAPWDGFTAEEQELLNAVRGATGSDKRARFAGVLKFLDKRIGAFVDMLDQEGWLENSVIVVASDNGACPSDGGTNYPLRGSKQSVYEGGSKVPAFVWSKSHLPPETWGTSYDKLMHSTDWLPTLASLAGAELTGSAGDLDGVDHWGSLQRSGLSDEADSSSDPRTEMLYNWDSYLLSSTSGLQENQELTQGAFRSGDWKLLVNVWCSGYYSHDAAVIESDELLDPEVTCPGTGECQDCWDRCQDDSDAYDYGDKLFNLKDDPREIYDLSDQHPEIVKELRHRAEEVAYAEYTKSRFLAVDTSSYSIWKESQWWMLPWEEILQSKQQKQQRSKSKLDLNGLM